MLTPSDILNHKFDKAGVFGYRPDDVDVFLNEVAGDYAALLREKEELEDKLEVLAGKLEEYRADEESLRTALLGAQKLGDSIVKESKVKAEEILRDATIKSERAIEANQARLEREKMNLARLQKEVGSFRNRLLSMYKSHLELISALPSSGDAAAPAEEKEETSAAPQPQEPETAREEREEQDDREMAETPEEEPREDAEDDFDEPDEPLREEQAPKRESRFGQLKFGEGYDLTREGGSSRGTHRRK